MAKIVPVVQLAAHAISSTLYSRSFGLRLYGRTVVSPNFFDLIGYFYFVLALRAPL